jgi:hypothetical protein
MERERREERERHDQERRREEQARRMAAARRRTEATARRTSDSGTERDEGIDRLVKDVIFRVDVELGHETHRGFMPSQYATAILIGSGLPLAEREAAYVKVREKLDVLSTPALTLSHLSDRERPGYVSGGPLRSGYEHMAKLRDFGGKPYVGYVYAAGLSRKLAVVERRRPERKGRPGELLDATVVVVPDGAFQRQRRLLGPDRIAPTPALKGWLERQFPPGNERPELPPPPPEDPDPFGTLMHSVGIDFPDDPEASR